MLHFAQGNDDFILRTETRLLAPLDSVFPFFADPVNLELLTPPFLQFKVLMAGTIHKRKGSTIDYQLRLYGLPITWRTLIKEWDPPFRFVDEQLKGPYRHWIHEHTFEENNGITICRDKIHYRVPGGKFIHDLIVKPDLVKIFTYRTKVLHDMFGEATQDSQGPNFDQPSRTVAAAG